MKAKSQLQNITLQNEKYDVNEYRNPYLNN